MAVSASRPALAAVWTTELDFDSVMPLTAPRSLGDPPPVEAGIETCSATSVAGVPDVGPLDAGVAQPPARIARRTLRKPPPLEAGDARARRAQHPREHAPCLRLKAAQACTPYEHPLLERSERRDAAGERLQQPPQVLGGRLTGWAPRAAPGRRRSGWVS